MGKKEGAKNVVPKTPAAAKADSHKSKGKGTAKVSTGCSGNGLL
jgi:hypothetical protein